MIKENDENILFSLSDPTFSSFGIVNIIIDMNATAVISKSDAITVNQLSPVIKLSVDVSGLRGKTVAAEFTMCKW